METPAILFIGAAGLVVGVPVAAYAVMVPADGPLPYPSWALLVPPRPRRVVAIGALLACALSVVLATSFGYSWELWVVWPSGLLGVGAALVDVRRRRLPFVMSGAMYAMSASVMTLDAVTGGAWAPAMRALVGCVAAGVLFLGVALAFPGQLGLGDVVFVGWIAMTLGWFEWTALGVGLMAGLLLQAVAAGTLMAWRRGPVEGGLPMGPALDAGWLMGVVSVAVG